jgi:hypothetical protein
MASPSALRRSARGVVLAALTGLVLGFEIGYGANSPPLIGSRTGAPIVILVASIILLGALLIGLLARAVAKRTVHPLVLAGVLVVACAIGLRLAPG